MKLHRIAGFSLIELMLVLAIICIVGLAIGRLFAGNFRWFQNTQARQVVMANSRVTMDAIGQQLRNGLAKSLVIKSSGGTSFVPNSRAEFTLHTPLPSSANNYAIYLSSGTVYGEGFNGTTTVSKQVLATNVTALMFTLDSRSPAFVGVSLWIDAPYDQTGDPTHVSSILLPNQTVHLVESQQ
jgi:prepilin-type N-terminal cleavage/methylation domain-containing protein